MQFLKAANELREKVRAYGKYRFVEEQTGVNYHWLQQFACGAIKNPTIGNLDKIEAFYGSFSLSNSEKLNSKSSLQTTESLLS